MQVVQGIFFRSFFQGSHRLHMRLAVFFISYTHQEAQWCMIATIPPSTPEHHCGCVMHPAVEKYQSDIHTMMCHDFWAHVHAFMPAHCNVESEGCFQGLFKLCSAEKLIDDLLCYSISQ